MDPMNAPLCEDLMPRALRFQPDEWNVHFVTTRCFQGRYLLRPSDKVRAVVVGILERAAQRTSCKLHGAVALSSHMHLLVSSKCAADLADYMEFVNGNIARELCRLHKWSDKFWQRRYQSAVCVDEASQVDRLAYLLSHGPKEKLVRSASRWPGLHTFKATCDGKRIHGHWVDRTAMYRASRHGKTVREADFTTPCTLTLHKLPCWTDLDDRTHAVEARRVYRERLDELGIDHHTPVLGVDAVCAIDPHAAPERSDHSPAPLCHAATKTARATFRNLYRDFVLMYRESLAALREHAVTIEFPSQGVPPGGLRAAPT